MGNYTIVIEGHGINHNAHPQDADVLAAEFMKVLSAAGQQDLKVRFVYAASLISEGIINTYCDAKLESGKQWTNNVKAPLMPPVCEKPCAKPPGHRHYIAYQPESLKWCSCGENDGCSSCPP